MEKQEVRSKWDELARELGAEAPPESERPKPAQSPEALSQAPIEPPKALTPPPKRAAADWNQLAGDLGLPPAPPPPPKPVARETTPEVRPSSRKPPATTEPSRESRAERTERTERTRDDGGPGQRRPRPPRPPRQRDNERDSERDEGERSGGERSGGERGGRRGGRRRGRRGSGEERETPRQQESSRQQDSTRHQEATRQRETPVNKPEHPARTERAEEPPVESPPSKPAVSLWQKIFGAPTDPSAKPAEEVVDRAFEDESSDDRRDDEGFVEDSMSASMTDEAVDMRSEQSRETTEGESEAGEQESGDRKRRRSRRRRGGRGRKSGESQDARRPSGRGRRDPEMLETPGADDFDDDFADLAVGESDESDGSGPEFDEEDDEDAGGELNGDAAPARGRSAGHRGIPSWDEAIGFIVETNMQSRSQRRPSGNSGQRGRPRGGRRRRKPS